MEGLSKERIRPYETLSANTDATKTILAYIALQEISSHFFVVLQLIEISLRNNLNSALTKYQIEQAAAQAAALKLSATPQPVAAPVGPATIWYDSFPKTAKSKSQVSQAKQDAAKNKPRGHSENDVICELTFGFWVYLLSRDYRSDFFWQKYAASVLPGKGGANIATVFDMLIRANGLRNRLYHHEPIWKDKKQKNMKFADAVNSLELKYNEMLNLLMFCAPEKHKLIHRPVLNLPAKFKASIESYKAILTPPPANT
jgi:hypothetical protein